jgi:hypothetical protein
MKLSKFFSNPYLITEFNAYTWNSIRKFDRTNFFLIYFQIFMIRFGRIDAVTYPNKPLWISMQNRLLNRVRFGQK